MIVFICFEELNFQENKAIYNSLLLQNKSRYMNAFELIIRFVSSNTVMTYDRNFVTYQRCNWTRLNEWRHSRIMIHLVYFSNIFCSIKLRQLIKNLHSNQISFCGILLDKRLFYFFPHTGFVCYSFSLTFVTWLFNFRGHLTSFES